MLVFKYQLVIEQRISLRIGFKNVVRNGRYDVRGQLVVVNGAMGRNFKVAHKIGELREQLVLCEVADLLRVSCSLVYV